MLPKPGIFQEHIQFLLVLTTPVDIVILGVSFTGDQCVFIGGCCWIVLCQVCQTLLGHNLTCSDKSFCPDMLLRTLHVHKIECTYMYVQNLIIVFRCGVRLL